VRTEWWYATGWLGTGTGTGIGTATETPVPTAGFQLTFFRSRTGLAVGHPSRLAARQLLFAHAAVTDLGDDKRRPVHHHAQRIARWNGDPQAAGARAALHDADVAMGDWTLRRDGDTWHARLPASDFALALTLQATQPTLLQGDAGFSRKGPQERQASHYYSEVQLAARGRLSADARAPVLQGRAWLDHEWSDEILHPEAVGWDWVGFNLFDGSALTAFRLRRREGASEPALWAGGSLRTAAGSASAPRSFAPGEVQFTPRRWWTSPASQARYPVEWQLDSPAGRHTVRTLLDAQEMDGRGGTGAIYWEGLSELLDAQGRRVGLGYLEMTGYAGALRL